MFFNFTKSFDYVPGLVGLVGKASPPPPCPPSVCMSRPALCLLFWVVGGWGEAGDGGGPDLATLLENMPE